MAKNRLRTQKNVGERLDFTFDTDTNVFSIFNHNGIGWNNLNIPVGGGSGGKTYTSNSLNIDNTLNTINIKNQVQNSSIEVTNQGQFDVKLRAQGGITTNLSGQLIIDLAQFSETTDGWKLTVGNNSFTHVDKGGGSSTAFDDFMGSSINGTDGIVYVKNNHSTDIWVIDTGNPGVITGTYNAQNNCTVYEIPNVQTGSVVYYLSTNSNLQTLVIADVVKIFSFAAAGGGGVSPIIADLKGMYSYNTVVMKNDHTQDVWLTPSNDALNIWVTGVYNASTNQTRYEIPIGNERIQTWTLTTENAVATKDPSKIIFYFQCIIEPAELFEHNISFNYSESPIGDVTIRFTLISDRSQRIDNEDILRDPTFHWFDDMEIRSVTGVFSPSGQYNDCQTVLNLKWHDTQESWVWESINSAGDLVQTGSLKHPDKFFVTDTVRELN